MLLTATTHPRNDSKRSADIWMILASPMFAVLCLVLAMPLAGETSRVVGVPEIKVSLSGAGTFQAAPTPGMPRIEQAIPGTLAACGEFGTPFVASLTPTSLAAGGTFQIAWCDPSWAYLDGAYAVDYFRIYIGSSPNGTFQAIGDPLAPNYGAVNIVTDSTDAGNTYYFFVRSFGRQFSFGNWVPTNKDTNVVSVQVTSSGGGGAGSCGQFGTPFNSAISPASVTAGLAAQLTWCNPSWAYLDGAYEVYYYVLYSSTSPNGPFAPFSDQIGPQYTGAQVSTGTGDGGKTYYILVRAFGREFSLGTWTNKNKDSSVSTLSVIGGGGGGGTCTTDAYTLCLYDARFKIQADYKDYSMTRGQAKAVAFTSDTGYFWIASDKNVEIVTKIVSFCGQPSNNYGFYAGGLTDMEVTIKVTDTKNNIYREYKNELGQAFTLKRDGPYPCP
jgi:hypothetical protein